MIFLNEILLLRIPLLCCLNINWAIYIFGFNNIEIVDNNLHKKYKSVRNSTKRVDISLDFHHNPSRTRTLLALHNTIQNTQSEISK